MKNNYDHIAQFYDRLSRLVFNKAQVNAQTVQLPYVPKKSAILIVGGGTGWILDELCNRHPAGLNISYVEQSARMLNLAKKASFRQNQVTFVHSAIQTFETTETFDVVITAFLFDNFSKESAEHVFHKLDHLLKKDGLWLYSDFAYPSPGRKVWQSLLLSMMYLFFKLVARVEANELTDMTVFFAQKKYVILFREHYYRGFIESCVYKKSRSEDPD